MSLQSKLYYWFKCDGCGADSTEEWETWPTTQAAFEYARNIGWTLRVDGHFCKDCWEDD